MKKKLFAATAVLIVLFMLYFIGSGFTRNTSVFIRDYSVSDDGREMTLIVGVYSSIGHIRDIQVNHKEGGKLFLDCCSSFGGVNGKIGAKDTFTIRLDESTSVIAFYRGSNCYEDVLVKAADGLWQRTGK